MFKISEDVLFISIFAWLLSSSVLADEDNKKEISASFLSTAQAPDSLTILPPPPKNDSWAFIRDKAEYQLGRSLQGSDRWKQAIIDSDLSDENIGNTFSSALGVYISEENTPITYELLKKIRTDSGRLATASAKRYYMRPRPFMFFNTNTCTPQDEQKLRLDGSYPSGHTAIGWTTALVLAEIRPERQNQLSKRGYEFGQSRVICGAHWQSDVDAGRIMGAVVFARLNADLQFMTMLKEAKKEINASLDSLDTIPVVEAQ